MTLQLAYQTVQQTLLILLPEIILIAAAIGMMTASPFFKARKGTWATLAIGGVLASIVALLAVRSVQADIYIASAINDDFSFYVRLLTLLVGPILIALGHREPSDDRAGEFFGSFLLLEAGTMLVASSNDIIMLVIGLELVSIPTYLLLYLSRRTTTTQEAATKYFYLSIFASGLLLYGMAFLYGIAGTTNLKALAFLSSTLPNVPHLWFGLLAVVFILAGLCFRVAAVPLHFYAPDVYQGSPTPITAMLSWIPKIVGFVAIIRVLTSVIAVRGAEDPLVLKAIWLSWIIAAASMTLGNFVALLQTDLKRMLAYSSIAHAGYLMIGVTVAFASGGKAGTFYHATEAILFYLVAYSLMTLGAFGVMVMLGKKDGGEVESIYDMSGSAWRRPIASLSMAICLLSLAGIPIFAGFWGKFQIFASAFSVQSGDEAWTFYTLAIIGVLNAAVGAFYYLRIIVLMYFGEEKQPLVMVGGWPVTAAVGVCAALSLLVGLFPAPISRVCRDAAFAAVAHPAPIVETAVALDESAPPAPAAPTAE